MKEKTDSSKGGKAEEGFSGGFGTYVEQISFTGRLSEFLISRIEEKTLVYIYFLFFGIGIFIFLLGFELERLWVFLLSYVFLITGAVLKSTRDYYRSRKCKNCGKDFAYVQTRPPEEKASGYDSVVETTSYYRCRFCGHEHVEVRGRKIIEQP